MGATVFHGEGDYAAFVELFDEARARVPMRLVAYCLMPNHFHLVLWPFADGELSRWMQWLMTTHVRRYHGVHGTSGHLWQGRFKAFPIQHDGHLVAIVRYVERNPLRAGLVERAEQWMWSSLPLRASRGPKVLLDHGPLPLPANWLRYVNEPQTRTELEQLRNSVNRGKPYGDDDWVRRAASRFGLASSMRPRGRPPKDRRQ